MPEDAQEFYIEVGEMGPETMMMGEPIGFISIDGKITDKEDALVFGTDHPDEIGLVILQCLSINGGTMGSKYFRPILSE